MVYLPLSRLVPLFIQQRYDTNPAVRSTCSQKIYLLCLSGVEGLLSGAQKPLHDHVTNLQLIEVNGNWSLLAGWQVRCGADVHGACARWITRTGSAALAHLPPWGLRKWCHQELFALQRYSLGKHPIAPCVSSCLVSATLSTIGQQAERTCHLSYAPDIDLRHL